MLDSGNKREINTKKYAAVALGLLLSPTQASALFTSEIFKEVRADIFNSYLSYLQNEKDSRDIEPDGDRKLK